MFRINKYFKVLKKRKDFLQISKSDLKWVSPGFIMQVRKTDENQNRIGFTVSKKVSKKAVTRNKIKRILRKLAQENLKDNTQKGLDIVLIGRKSTLDTPYEDMVSSLKFSLKKLDLRK